MHRDELFMSRAIFLAKQGRFSTKQNPNVGAVIVYDDRIIGEGYHLKPGEKHAEIMALDAVDDRSMLKDATLYVTLEPCCHQGLTGACSKSIITAGIKKVKIAMVDPNPLVSGKGINALKAAGIQVEVGMLEDDVRSINKGFIKRMEKKMPYVRVKLAQSLDGKTAMQSGESKWITGGLSRSNVQTFRALSCAMLTSSATVNMDDPLLSVRENQLEDDLKEIDLNLEEIQPKKLILDRDLKINLDAKILQSETEIVIFHAALSDQEKIEKAQLLLNGTPHRLIQVGLDENGQLSLNEVLSWAAENQMNDIMVEAGAKLATSFIEQELVDELIIYTAPMMMGSEARPIFNKEISEMKHAKRFEGAEYQQFGQDMRMIVRMS